MNTFKIKLEGSVAKLILSEPAPGETGGDFPDSLRAAVRLANESSARALVLTSETGNFLVTNDPSELMAHGSKWLEAFVADVMGSIRIIEEMRIPTIASVAGNAFGGGFEVALACDFLVVSDQTTLWLPEAAVGAVPLAGGVQRVAERVGRARAARLTLLAEPVSGKAALEMGLATHLAPAAEMERVTADLATHIVRAPSRSFAAIRSLLRAWSVGGVAGADVAMASINDGVFATESTRRGMAAAAEAMKAGRPFESLNFADIEADHSVLPAPAAG